MKNNKIQKLKNFLDKNCIRKDGEKMDTFFNDIKDIMETIYDKDGIIIRKFKNTEWIEIAGLDKKEQEEIEKYGYTKYSVD